MRILLIENSLEAISKISNILKSKEIVIDSCTSTSDALRMCSTHEYNIIILQQSLKEIPGDVLVEQMRSSKINTPIFVISRENSVEKKISALRKGADDYLIEPFNIREFLARIKAVIRRTNGYSQNKMKNGDLEIDFTEQKAYYSGENISLTKKEYMILEFLFLKKGSTLDKNRFLNHLYGNDNEPEIKIIDVFICKLRKKLEDISGGINFIGTDWGRGYYLVDLEK